MRQQHHARQCRRTRASEKKTREDRDHTFQQAFEGGEDRAGDNLGGDKPTKPHATHSEKRRGMRDAPGPLESLSLAIRERSTGFTTSFFCVRAMRRGPVPSTSSAFHTRTNLRNEC